MNLNLKYVFFTKPYSYIVLAICYGWLWFGDFLKVKPMLLVEIRSTVLSYYLQIKQQDFLKGS